MSASGLPAETFHRKKRATSFASSGRDRASLLWKRMICPPCTCLPTPKKKACPLLLPRVLSILDREYTARGTSNSPITKPFTSHQELWFMEVSVHRMQQTSRLLAGEYWMAILNTGKWFRL